MILTGGSVIFEASSKKKEDATYLRWSCLILVLSFACAMSWLMLHARSFNDFQTADSKMTIPVAFWTTKNSCDMVEHVLNVSLLPKNWSLRVLKACTQGFQQQKAHVEGDCVCQPPNRRDRNPYLKQALNIVVSEGGMLKAGMAVSNSETRRNKQYLTCLYTKNHAFYEYTLMHEIEHVVLGHLSLSPNWPAEVLDIHIFVFEGWQFCSGLFSGAPQYYSNARSRTLI